MDAIHAKIEDENVRKIVDVTKKLSRAYGIILKQQERIAKMEGTLEQWGKGMDVMRKLMEEWSNAITPKVKELEKYDRMIAYSYWGTKRLSENGWIEKKGNDSFTQTGSGELRYAFNPLLHQITCSQMDAGMFTHTIAP